MLNWGKLDVEGDEVPQAESQDLSSNRASVMPDIAANQDPLSSYLGFVTSDSRSPYLETSVEAWKTIKLCFRDVASPKCTHSRAGDFIHALPVLSAQPTKANLHSASLTCP